MSKTLTEDSMFFLSWLTALRSGTTSVCLMTETDSPVGGKKCYVRHLQDECMIQKFESESGCLTCQDGLINTQSGGFNTDESDVSWDFVTN